MIISIGIDIIEVARVQQSITRTSRFRERVFTPAEIEYCEARSAKFQHYAARFAAKEAAFKALGTGWSGGVGWHDVEVENESNGAPRLKLSGRAFDIFRSLGAARAHLSISHTGDYAIAQVILENSRQ